MFHLPNVQMCYTFLFLNFAIIFLCIFSILSLNMKTINLATTSYGHYAFDRLKGSNGYSEYIHCRSDMESTDNDNLPHMDFCNRNPAWLVNICYGNTGVPQYIFRLYLHEKIEKVKIKEENLPASVETPKTIDLIYK